jgi:HK97 family phage major capsid protein
MPSTLKEKAIVDLLEPRRSGIPWSFLKAIVANDRAEVHKNFSSVQKAVMATTSGVVGGYTTPVEYSTALLQSLQENSFLRPRATIVPMKSTELVAPKPRATDVQSAGVAPWFGGIYFTWGQGAGGDTVSESEPTFDQTSLVARDLIGQILVSNQFLMDLDAAGEQALVKLFGKAAAWYEEYAFLRGLGASNSQPLGILNAQAKINVTRQTASHVTETDIATMASKLMPFSWANSIWAVSTTAVADLVRISGFQANQDSFVAEKTGCVGTLYTRPVFVSGKLPAIGTAGDVMFFDPSLYVIGDRQEVTIDSSPHPLFRTAQTVFRVWLRVDGRPMLDGDITLSDATTTAASIVVLN